MFQQPDIASIGVTPLASEENSHSHFRPAELFIILMLSATFELNRVNLDNLLPPSVTGLCQEQAVTRCAEIIQKPIF